MLIFSLWIKKVKPKNFLFILAMLWLNADANQERHELDYNFTSLKSGLPFIDVDNDARMNLLMLIELDKNIPVLNSKIALDSIARLDNQAILNTEWFDKTEDNPFISPYQWHIKEQKQNSNRVLLYWNLYRNTLDQSDLSPLEKLLLGYLQPLYFQNGCIDIPDIDSEYSQKTYQSYLALFYAINDFRCKLFSKSSHRLNQIHTNNEYVNDYISYLKMRSRFELIQKFGLTETKAFSYWQKEILNYLEKFPNGAYVNEARIHNATFYRMAHQEFEPTLNYLSDRYKTLNTYEQALEWVGTVNSDYLAHSQSTIFESIPVLNAANTLRFIRDFDHTLTTSAFTRNKLLTRVDQSVDFLKQRGLTELALLIDVQAYWKIEQNPYLIIQAIEKHEANLTEFTNPIHFAFWVLKADAYEKIGLFQQSQLIWHRLLEAPLLPAQSFYAQFRLADSLFAQNNLNLMSNALFGPETQITQPEIRQTLFRFLDNQTLLSFIEHAEEFDRKNEDKQRILRALIDNNLERRDWHFLETYLGLLSHANYLDINLEERADELDRWIHVRSIDLGPVNSLYFFSNCGTLNSLMNTLISSEGRDPKALFCLLGYLMTSDSSQSKVLLKNSSFKYAKQNTTTPINDLLSAIFYNQLSSQSEKKLALSTLIHCNAEGYARYEYRGRCETKQINSATRFEWAKLYEQHFNEKLRFSF